MDAEPMPDILAQFQHMSAERFAWMVKRQKRIQKSANLLLGYLERYDEYTEIIIDDLNNIAETLEDAAFEKMVQEIDLNAEDKGLSKVKQALAYICENYRIERKVIRNRRQLISEKMAKRTLHAIPYTPLSLNENYNEIGAIQNIFHRRGHCQRRQHQWRGKLVLCPAFPL